MPIPPSTTAAAATFAKKWANLGDEKQDSQRFWFELLQKVYGVEDPASFVRFEQRVKLSHVSFIDVMIPATHTMIEMKSRGKDLDAPIKQSDGTFLKPFEQAKRYAAALPYSERPRWIVSCNFAEFHVYDMERPNDEPERILLKDLGKEAYRLKFLVDVRDSHIQREMDLSREAGTLVGRIYNALLPAYGDAPTAKDLQDLNKLIVRLVFCFYAEDAGLFGARNAFQHCMETFRAENFRLALITLFRVLDQKPEERDRFLDPKFAAFPYVNGSLFTEDVPVPPMDEPTRTLILEEGCGFDWSGISPTIFGEKYQENSRCTNTRCPWELSVSEDFFVSRQMDTPWASKFCHRKCIIFFSADNMKAVPIFWHKAKRWERLRLCIIRFPAHP